MRLKNKKAIITAAASGMGQAGVELFAREGAHVVAVDQDAEKLNAIVEAVTAAGGQATAIVADLLQPEACSNAVDEAASAMGGVDILWNHAGVPGKRDIENLDLPPMLRRWI